MEALSKNKKSLSKQDGTQDKFLSYKLIVHVYLMRPWFYSPFQECLMLNFVQVCLIIFDQFRFLNFLKSQTSQNSCLYIFVIFSLTT